MLRPDSGFSERLKALVGNNESAFARRIGMPQTTINRYVSGKSTPSYELFLRLTGAGIDLHWLLTGQFSSAIEGMAVSERGSPYGYELPERVATLISELENDSEGMAELEGMIEGFVRARRKVRKSKAG